MEDAVGFIQNELVSEAIDNALKMEKERTNQNAPKQLSSNLSRLSCLYDMGWNQYSTRYDTASSHVFLFRVYCQKVLGLEVLLKLCRFCIQYLNNNKNNEENEENNNIPEHKCSKNYDESSKGMES